jgi:hypothetical protein
MKLLVLLIATEGASPKTCESAPASSISPCTVAVAWLLTICTSSGRSPAAARRAR